LQLAPVTAEPGPVEHTASGCSWEVFHGGRYDQQPSHDLRAGHDLRESGSHQGHHAANPFAFHASGLSGWGQWTFFSTVVLALLGIEVPLNMGVEIKSEKSIKRYLFWGCLVVIVAYLWATFSNMVSSRSRRTTPPMA
jgi:hypothetical protein